MLYIGCWACHYPNHAAQCVQQYSLQIVFFFRGSHEFLSACTLPKWVPEPVTTHAIMYYCNCLREALEDLMASSKVVRNLHSPVGFPWIALREMLSLSLRWIVKTASFPTCLAYESIQVRRPPSTSDPIPFSGLCLIMDPCQWCHMIMVDTRTSLCHHLSSFLVITCVTGFRTSFKHR